jgi:hypothetical protein
MNRLSLLFLLVLTMGGCTHGSRNRTSFLDFGQRQSGRGNCLHQLEGEGCSSPACCACEPEVRRSVVNSGNDDLPFPVLGIPDCR